MLLVTANVGTLFDDVSTARLALLLPCSRVLCSDSYRSVVLCVLLRRARGQFNVECVPAYHQCTAGSPSALHVIQ
ncbi:hypothetical protein NDU88_007765 [Pleurodeles waltl]|uniref:Secreted protein n=1 Tax=Pleurodeles waltl TaxID=8319 RepID=A0AAV7QLK4_PLEWA|nr:hypothetical protein NDU88_007765 [Pleurodeles waltl]